MSFLQSPGREKPYNLLSAPSSTIVSTALCAVAVACALLYYAYDVFAAHWHLLSNQIIHKSAYRAGTLIMNYFNSGFIRRGLGGTIAAFFSENLYWRGICFHLFSIGFVAVPLFLLIRDFLRRVDVRSGLYVGLIVVLSPQTFLAWSNDIARTDLLVESFLLWAVLCVTRRHVILGALCVLAGLLAHEIAMIFGAPLLLVVVLASADPGGAKRKELAQCGLVLVAGAVLILLAQSILTHPRSQLIATCLDAIATWGKGDLEPYLRGAVYFALPGFKGPHTAVCENLHDPRYPINVVLGLLIIAIYAALLTSGRGWRYFLLCTLPPYVFMVLIATDTGRWLKFAVANGCWLSLGCSSALTPFRPTRTRVVAASAALLALLAMGPTHVFSVSPASDDLMDKVGLEPNAIVRLLGQCDPDWAATSQL